MTFPNPIVLISNAVGALVTNCPLSGKYLSVINFPDSEAVEWGTQLPGAYLNAVLVKGDGQLKYKLPDGTAITAAAMPMAPNSPGEFEIIAYVETTYWYGPASKSKKVQIKARMPSIEWGGERKFAYGTALTDTKHLNAKAVWGPGKTSVSGTFTYKLESTGAIVRPGGKLDAGNQKVTASFVADDTNRYMAPESQDLVFEVSRVEPTVTWGPVADVEVNTSLDANLLSANATYNGEKVEGRISILKEPSTYAVKAGVAFDVSFNPNSNNFKPVKFQLSVNVVKGRFRVTWQTPADIVYGTLLSGTQLSAVVNPRESAQIDYDPGAGKKLDEGAHDLRVRVRAKNDKYFDFGTTSVRITVTPAMPEIIWAPEPANPNQALGASQLNAKARFEWHRQDGQLMVETPDGAMTYSTHAAQGAVGVQQLQCTFTPANPARFRTPPPKVVSLKVMLATPSQITTAGLDQVQDKVLNGKTQKEWVTHRCTLTGHFEQPGLPVRSLPRHATLRDSCSPALEPEWGRSVQRGAQDRQRVGKQGAAWGVDTAS